MKSTEVRKQKVEIKIEKDEEEDGKVTESKGENRKATESKEKNGTMGIKDEETENQEKTENFKK